MAELYTFILVALLIILFANMFLFDFIDDKEIMSHYEKAKAKVDEDINNA